MPAAPFRALLVAAAVLGSTLSIPETATAAPQASDGRLVIGSLAPETGLQANLLESLRAPVQLAVDEVNAAGGVNGAPVSLVTGDEGESIGAARATFDRLATAGHADAIVGPTSPAAALALVGQIAERGVLTCSGTDTSAAITPSSSGGYYFRTAPPDRLQARALAELVIADHRARVAILWRDDEYGKNLAASLRSRLQSGGVEVVRSARVQADAGSVASTVQRVALAEPDAVVVLAFADDGAGIVRELVARGIGPSAVGVYGSDGIQSAAFAATVDANDPGAVSGIKGTAPAPAPGGTQTPFAAALVARNIEPLFSAYLYDCAVLIALAATRAHSDDPALLKRAFTENLRGAADCGTFAECKQLLDSGTTIHWRGASSAFDRYRGFEPGEGTYDVWSYDAGGFVVTADASQQIHVG